MDRAIEIGVLVGLARLLFERERAPHPSPSPGEPIRRRELGAALLGAGSLALVGFRGYVAADGVPAYRHDWAWPVDDVELRHAFTFLTADWRAEAMGTPKPYPTLYPLFAVASALGNVLHTQTVLVLLLAGCATAAAAGAYLLARRLVGATLPAAAFSGALYAAAPFLVDKTVAGHVHIVLAYALLPWLGLVQLAADRAAARALPSWTAAAAALYAATMCALTFVAFSAVAMAAVAATLQHRRRAFAVAAVAALLAVCSDAQSLYHLATQRDLDNGRSGYDWLAYLSSSSTAVLGQYSYLPGYAKDAVPAWVAHAAEGGVAPLALATLGLVAALGSRRAAAFGVVGLVGVVGATGVDGPFALLKRPAYEHVHALAAFREFYNFESLIALGLCGAGAAVLSACGRWVARGDAPRRAAGAVAWVAASSAAVLLALPDLSGAASRVPTVREPAVLAELAGRLSPGRAERIAFFPLVQPLRPGSAHFGGTDPFALGFRGHATLAEWQPGASVALAAVDAVAGRTEATLHLFDAFGVRWIVLREGISSAAADFWFPHTFARGWGRETEYAALAASPRLRAVAHADGLTLLENPNALPALALGPPPERCIGDGLLALAAGRCPRAARDESKDGRFDDQREGDDIELPLLPDPRIVDPNLGWTSLKAFYGLAPALAAAEGGVGTLGSGAWSTAWTARAGGELYVRCASSEGIRLYLDARPMPTDCRAGFASPMPWFDAGAVAAGPHRVVAVSAEGISVIERLVVAPRRLAAPEDALASFAWSPPGGARLGSVRFTRTSATEAEGIATVLAPAVLIFSDSYDPHWRLRVDDRDEVPPERVNRVENAFALGLGTHRFTLRYVPGAFDRALGTLEGATWIGIVAVIARALLAAGRRSLLREENPIRTRSTEYGR